MSGFTNIRFAWYVLLISLVTMSGVTACASSGGKGLARARDVAFDYIDEISEETDEASSDSMGGAPLAENLESSSVTLSQLGYINSGSPSDSQDPFGLIPQDWPDDVEIHPSAKIVQRRNLASDGYFLLVLIPSSQATILGVQTFHIDKLSGWESLEVEEGSQDKNEGTPVLTIIGERDGAWLKITAEEAQPGYLESLENYEFWEVTVGIHPLIVRMYYVPISSHF